MHPLVIEIGNLSVMELVNLTKDIEDKFGVSGAQVFTQQEATIEEVKAPEKTEFDVVLTSYGKDKVGAIKLLKELYGMTLLQAKGMLETLPQVLKEKLNEHERDTLTARLDAAGITYEIK